MSNTQKIATQNEVDLLQGTALKLDEALVAVAAERDKLARENSLLLAALRKIGSSATLEESHSGLTFWPSPVGHTECIKIANTALAAVVKP